MTFSLVLWALVWGGMFTGIYNLVPFPSVDDRLALFQALRALLPVAAAYVCLLWALAARARFRFHWTTPGFLVYYGAFGLVASIFYSPDAQTALYWCSAYLAPFLVGWFVVERPEPVPILRTILRANYAILVFLFLAVLTEAARFGFGRATRYQIYQMPFGLGEVRSNGVGRYALVGSASKLNFVGKVFHGTSRLNRKMQHPSSFGVKAFAGRIGAAATA